MCIGANAYAVCVCVCVWLGFGMLSDNGVLYICVWMLSDVDEATQQQVLPLSSYLKRLCEYIVCANI